MATSKTITVDGLQYDCKRYSYNDLKKMFDGKVVVLKDPEYKDMNLVSGILLDVCEESEINKRRLEYLKAPEKNLTLWDFSPAPILSGYRMVV